ncbi:proteasome assembly chaperone 2 [Bradysia coprophila]|uniref:proteasome assembly chaperone 2 n=1 Tax=Bradysia coprophila TaxID=38358 RepID=UPI00187DBE3F|nr:proteasome assembly chaperone 2 [Bradysia coprophila]
MVKTNLINFNKTCDIAGYTVLLPSIGVGNVAQLSVDLLISTLQMEKVATVWHSSIVPIIGPKAFQHDTSNITTSCELYVSNAKKIAAFQLRSPLVAATMNEFFNELIDFLKSRKIAKLILLTSSYAYEQHFVGANPFAVIVDDAFRGVETDAIQRMKWNEFQGDIIHGGGYVKQLMSVASRNGIPTLTLFKYVSEGDNSADAVTLLEELNAGFNIIERTGEGKLNIIFPVSWKSLFGNPIPEQLY